MVIIANARYYAQLLRNRPVESDSTGNRTYYETLKISLVLEPSSPEQSARVDTLVVDSATRPFIPRATLPLDRSTLSVRVETTRRVLRSRSETFYYETIYIFSSNRYFLSAQRNHLSLPYLLARGAFSGPRRLFHRRSSSFPSRGRTRARTRRRDGSFDEKSILSSKVKKHT